MKELMLVCVGGALGSGARHLVASGVGAHALRAYGSAFPWGTLAVNAIGSLLLGALFAWGGEEGPSRTTRMLLGSGALGGFTTYSTFNWETLCLLRNQTGTALTYIALTLVVCLLFGTAGLLTARALTH